MADLKSRCDEDIGGNLKLAVFMSILPKDYREEIFKMGSGDKRLEYGQVRGYVLTLAQQRANSMTPKSNE
eukprot:900606-Karenia_brevis.AAC.1